MTHKPSVSGVRAPDATSQGASIRLLEDMGELVECEAIQREVWGLEDRDIVPAAQFRAASHAGGHVVGAFVADELVGFAYAFVAAPHGRGMAGIGLHSHMVAVRAGERAHGLGRSLKWFQRTWALERGFKWITWTFDPLQARNANLNLRHLGAVCNDYLVDFYGTMPGTLGGGQASDRLLALWLLDAARVSRLAATFTAERVAARAAVVARGGADDVSAAIPAGPRNSGPTSNPKESWLLSADDVLGHAAAGATDLFETTAEKTRRMLTTVAADTANDPIRNMLRIAAPAEVNTLMSHQPDLANLWRLGIRAAMTLSLGAGFTVTGFDNGAYMLALSRKEEADF